MMYLSFALLAIIGGACVIKGNDFFINKDNFLIKKQTLVDLARRKLACSHIEPYCQIRADKMKRSGSSAGDIKKRLKSCRKEHATDMNCPPLVPIDCDPPEMTSYCLTKLRIYEGSQVDCGHYLGWLLCDQAKTDGHCDNISKHCNEKFKGN